VFTYPAHPSPATPVGSVPLVLTTSDRASRIVATATPTGPEAKFEATFVVPADAPPGRARIADDQQHIVTLTIT
jgi:hypothetical protein